LIKEEYCDLFFPDKRALLRVNCLGRFVLARTSMF
jgi:hypothetical protein